MNVSCSAEPCPILLDSTCVFYSGANLIYTGITTNDSLQVALQKIDAKFQDAGIGYAFQNGIIQSSPGQPVKLGGSLNQNTTINSGPYTFALTGTIQSSAFITAGGTSSQFVKGDGSLDNTSYQPSGTYITALTGDGTATGPGSAVFSLDPVSALFSGTWGSATQVPRFVLDTKGRVLSVTNVPINLPPTFLTFVGDVYGSGPEGSNINLTISNVLGTPGTFGSTTQTPVITVNAKGQITAISQVPSGGGGGGTGTVTNVSVTSGTGISASVTNPTTTPNITITNTAPDQTVVLNSGTGISTSGTYPNFTITNSAPDQTVALTSGTGISVTGTYPNFTITNTSPSSGGTVTGTGTTNYVPKWSSSTALTDSSIFDNGTSVGIGTATPSATYKLDVVGSTRLGTLTTHNVVMGNGLNFDFSSSRSRIYSNSAINVTSLLSTGTRLLFGTVGGNTATTGLVESELTIGDVAQTSGTYVNTRISGRLLNSSGSAVYNYLEVQPNLSTSGSYTGTLRGFYYNPTTTLPFGGTEIAFENTRGSVIHGNLAGVGTRMVTADSTGTLGTTAIPTGSGIFKGTASGTDTYTTTIAGVTSYADGDAYLIRFTNGNTTGCTLNINGLGARTLYRNNDGVLIGGDIVAGAEMFCIYNSTLTGFQVIGTAPNTLLGYVTNDDSVTITKGQVVYAFGGQGDRMTVKLANNTSDATSARTVGVVLSTSIAANQKGLIMMQGLLDGLSILPTATYSDGDPVYLGATAGSITNVKPYAPNHLVYVATVTTASNGSSGRMYVNIQNGYELDELHNVQAQSPALKDTLWYDSTVSPGQWKTASISTILGYTPVGGSGTTNQLAYFTGSTTLGSLTTATYPSLTELSYVKGVTSSIQTQINNTSDVTINTYQALGSSVKAQAMGLSMTNIVTQVTILSGNQSFIRVIPIYLQSAQTLNGIIWYQATSGAYTANNENRVALYSYSAGVATLVASSANDANLWTGASNTWQSKAFSSPYVASAGFYYIGLLMSSSATTTSPTIGAASNLLAVNIPLRQLDFTNSALSYGIRATVVALPGSFTVGTYLNGANQNIIFAAVY